MSLLKNLATESTISTEEKDSLGGRSLFDTNIYLMDIAMAYLMPSKGEALGLALTLKAEDGREHNQTIYITSGKDKGKLPYYIDKEGQKQYLPGFLQANSLAQLTTGMEINQLDTEQKVVNIYNFDAKAEVPTKVEVVMDLLGKQVYVGLQKQTVDKNIKNEAGVYVASGETREINEIDKFFCAKESHLKMTTAEIRGKAEKASFYDSWLEKNAGKVINKAKGAAAGGTAGAPGKAAGPAAGTKPTSSLFSQ